MKRAEGEGRWKSVLGVKSVNVVEGGSRGFKEEVTELLCQTVDC